MTKLTLKDLSLLNRRVLMRVDFNVPLYEDGSISDDSRIRAALPSIRYILDQGASLLILMSHLGRPKGSVNKRESLDSSAKRLSGLLEKPVIMAQDCVGPSVEALLAQAPKGSVVMLENLRFHPGEEDPQKNPEFVEQLARLGDLYVNEAFGTAHRAHASTAQIAAHFPGKAAIGFLIEKELFHLMPLLHNPKRPFHAILAGAKISSKVGVLKQLLTKIDALYVGGAMAFPFLKAQSISIGSSLCDEADVQLAREILAEAEKRGVPLYLPIDTVAAKEGEEPKVFLRNIDAGWSGMDLGPKTTAAWKESLAEAVTVFWNGPVGVFEKPPFDRATGELAAFLAQLKGATVIVGGGDSVAAVQRLGFGAQFAHLSTGGGASLEFLEWGHLPGIDALSDK